MLQREGEMRWGHILRKETDLQDRTARHLENYKTFFGVWNALLWLEGFCLLFWRLVVMSEHGIVV